MKYLDLTLRSPAANLACDEALLDTCDANGGAEVLRFWESDEHFVVVGYANRVSAEVNLEACRARNIPVLRRCSGGGAVVQGPGCLNYSLVLRIPDAGALGTVTGANAFVMDAHRAALSVALGANFEVQGHTDLTAGSLKFSGNAQRRKKHFLLFHGTFLLRFDLALLEELLLPPTKQPAYRQSRPHNDFVKNLNVSPDLVREALRKTWQAEEPLASPPWAAIDLLTKEKYAAATWNFRLG